MRAHAQPAGASRFNTRMIGNPSQGGGLTEPGHSRTARQPIDYWLRRDLKRRYDRALDETLPRELVDLIDDAEPKRR